MIMEVTMDINKLKLLIPSGVDVNPDRAQLLYDMTVQSVLNYCNLSELPVELEPTVMSIVAELYVDLMTTPTADMVNIASISEGDRQVSFRTGRTYGFDVGDRLIKKKELDKFKRLYKID